MTASTPAGAAAETALSYGRRPRAGAARFARRAWRTNPAGCVAVAVLVAWAVIALTIPAWAPYRATEQDVAHRLEGPSGDHLMGTDSLGRDVLTRVFFGTRISLPASVIVIIIAGSIGTFLGALAGFAGRFVDEIVMRLCDITLAFPAIVLAMAIAASLGTSLNNAMIAIIAVWWPFYARLMRAQVLSILPREHVLGARALGANEVRVFLRHVLPLSLGPVLVQATMDFGSVVLLLAGLSFIGLGAVPPSPEWGAMISDGRLQFYSWWIATAPGVAILTVVLAFNFIGDALLDLLDPRRRGYQQARA